MTDTLHYWAARTTVTVSGTVTVKCDHDGKVTAERVIEVGIGVGSDPDGRHDVQLKDGWESDSDFRSAGDEMRSRSGVSSCSDVAALPSGTAIVMLLTRLVPLQCGSPAVRTTGMYSTGFGSLFEPRIRFARV